MATEAAAGVDPVQPETIVPGETIATEMPSLPNSDDPAPEPIAEPDETDPAAPPAPAPEPAATRPQEKQPLTWQEKRRIEETNKRRAAEAERDSLKAELDRLRKAPASPSADPANPTPAPAPAATLTPEQARAAARADIEAEEAQRAFSEATGRVLSAGLASIPGFEQARVEMVNNFGDQLNATPDFFEAITSLENGHEVFFELANDPERTEKLLAMTPTRRAIEIAKLGDKKPATPEPAPISKVPAPVKPVGGATQSTERLDDPNTPMDTWAKTFLKQMAGKGR